MKIVVTRDEIMSKLSNIQNIVEKRNTMPILSHFLLDANRRAPFMIATDLDTALKEPLRLNVEKEGNLCIPARKLFEIIREIDGEIVMESIDEQWLRIKSGASSFRLACLPSKEFPAWPAMEDVEEVKVKGGVLVEMIEKTVYAAGESDTRYTLNGLLLHIAPGIKATLVGTDGHRLALITKMIEGTLSEAKKLIIPRKAASELRKIIDKGGDEISMGLGKNHVLFTMGDMQFLTRLIEGTYPNYEQVVPTNNDKRIAVGREAFAKTVRRVAIMSRERSNAVKVDLTENLMTITSSNPDLGEAHDEIPIEYSGEALTLGFNARYLQDVLESMSSDRIILEFQTALSPVLITEEQGGDYRCVIMPMRI